MDPSPVIAIKNDYTFDTGQVPVNSTSVWQPIGRFLTQGKTLILRGVVGAAGGLSQLKITAAAKIADNHSTLAANSDFAAAEPGGVGLILSDSVDGSGKPSPETSAAGGTFLMRLDAQAAEYAIYAMAAAANTTLELTGSMWPTVPSI